MILGNTQSETSWRPNSRHAALLATLSIVALTCLPVLQYPQLEPDDYRYLENADRLTGASLVDAAIVENRWDSLWWVDTEARVRFFRPTVVASYWLDRQLWGSDYELGLLVTNVMIWAGCAVAAWWLACFWLGDGLSVLLASAAFAALFCHGEVIWYVAGRTDSLAALGFLVALALHLGGREAPRRRWLAVPLFGLAFLTKELAVVLPPLLFLHDLLIERRAPTARRLMAAEGRLYLLYAAVAVAVAVYGAKTTALAGERSELVYPYLVAPLSAAFPAHLWTQFRAYGENLLLASPTAPFLAPEQLPVFTSPPGLWLSLAVLALLLLVLCRRRLFWFLSALAFATWLPVSFVYVSERFLLLPSLALTIAAGLLLRSVKGRALRAGTALVIAAWVVHQGWWLRVKNSTLMATPRSAKIVEEGLAPYRSELRGASDLLLVNLPGELFEGQFVESQLRVQLDNPGLRVRVLTLMPADTTLAAGLRTTICDDSLTVEGAASPAGRRFPVMRYGRFPFSRVPMETGRRYGGGETGFEVEVLQGSGSVSRRLRFVFDRALAEQHLVVWEPLQRPELPRLERVRRGRVRLLQPPPKATGRGTSSALGPPPDYE